MDAKVVVNEVDYDFYKILDTVEIINFTGGETILQPQVHELIDYLIEQDLAKNITLTLLTNASKYPDKLIDRFKQFKDVFYTVSIDGLGDVIEYQRRGAVWVDVETNALRLWKEFGAVVNYVITPVNVFTITDFLDWAYSHNMDIIYISLVFGANYFPAAVIPDELRLPLVDQLLQYKTKFGNSKLDQYYIELVDRVCTILTVEHNPQLLEKFIRKIRDEDAASKKKLSEVVPEWKPYFE